MKRPASAFQTRPLTRWLAWLCLALLLSAQGLGQVHRIAHAHAHHESQEDHGHDGWGHAGDSADCQILDHLAQDGAPAALSFALPAELPQGWFAAPAPRAVFLAAQWSRGARAPPALQA